MKTVQETYDEMRAADVPNWDGISGPLKAFAQIATSVAEWLEANAPDIRASVTDVGDAADGDDWIEVVLSRPGESASGEFKVGVAPD